MGRKKKEIKMKEPVRKRMAAYLQRIKRTNVL